MRAIEVALYSGLDGDGEFGKIGKVGKIGEIKN